MAMFNIHGSYKSMNFIFTVSRLLRISSESGYIKMSFNEYFRCGLRFFVLLIYNSQIDGFAAPQVARRPIASWWD